MQPYQRAGDVMRSKAEQPFNYVQRGTKLGLSLAGASILPKAMSFLTGGLSPEGIIRGLKSINPKFGKFIDSALQKGRSFNEIKDFIVDKIQTAEKSRPETLFEKLAENIDISSLESNVQKEMGFLQMIAQQLEEKGIDEKDPMAIKLKKKIQKAVKGKGELFAGPMEEASIQSGNQPITQQTQQQAGPGQQALMAILQKIQAQRGQ